MIPSLSVTEGQVKNMDFYSSNGCFAGGASGKESACQWEMQETQVQSLDREDPLE